MCVPTYVFVVKREKKDIEGHKETYRDIETKAGKKIQREREREKERGVCV